MTLQRSELLAPPVGYEEEGGWHFRVDQDNPCWIQVVFLCTCMMELELLFFSGLSCDHSWILILWCISILPMWQIIHSRTIFKYFTLLFNVQTLRQFKWINCYIKGRSDTITSLQPLMVIWLNRKKIVISQNTIFNKQTIVRRLLQRLIKHRGKAWSDPDLNHSHNITDLTREPSFLMIL